MVEVIIFHTGLDQELLKTVVNTTLKIVVDVIARLVELILQTADCTVKSIILQLLVVCFWRAMCVITCQDVIIAGRQLVSTWKLWLFNSNGIGFFDNFCPEQVLRFLFPQALKCVNDHSCHLLILCCRCCLVLESLGKFIWVPQYHLTNHCSKQEVKLLHLSHHYIDSCFALCIPCCIYSLLPSALYNSIVATNACESTLTVQWVGQRTRTPGEW